MWTAFSRRPDPQRPTSQDPGPRTRTRTRTVKMWSSTFCLFFFCCGFLRSEAHLAVGNKRPYFDSRNFHNVLRWDRTEPAKDQEPGPPARTRGPRQPVLYSVMYRSFEDGAPVRPKRECQNISTRSCDLTAETPSRPDRYYEALLYADGQLLGKAYRFLPIADTVLGAPTLSMRVSGSSLFLDVVLPRGPGGVPLLALLNQSRRFTLEPAVSYALSITQPRWAALVNHSLAPRFALQLKNNDTRYCGHVVYRPTMHIGRPPSQNASFCILMPRDRGATLPWVLVAGGLVLVPVVLGVVLVYVYTHPRKKPRLPRCMQVVSSQPRLLCSPDLNFIRSVPEVWPPQEKKPRPPLKLVSVDPGGYSPQCEPSREDSSFSSSSAGGQMLRGGGSWSRCRSSTTQSSVSYAHVSPNVGHEDGSAEGPCVDLPPPRDHPGPKKTSTQAGTGTGPFSAEPPAPSDPGDTPAGPRVLLVPTVRNAEGQLVLTLPPAAFQWQAGGEEEEEEAQEEEQKPLLVGVGYKAQGPPLRLLSLGSAGGSDDQSSSSTPTQLWGSSPGQEGAYKPNSFSVGGAAHWPWPPPGEVGGGAQEEEEEEPGDGQLFLRDWVIHVQDEQL